MDDAEGGAPRLGIGQRDDDSHSASRDAPAAAQDQGGRRLNVAAPASRPRSRAGVAARRRLRTAVDSAARLRPEDPPAAARH